jgi:hypothetical protein
VGIEGIPTGSGPVTEDGLIAVLLTTEVVADGQPTSLSDRVTTLEEAGAFSDLSDDDPADVAAAPDPGVAVTISRSDHAHALVPADFVAPLDLPGGVTGATLDDLQVVGDDLDAVKAALIAAGLMAAS